MSKSSLVFFVVAALAGLLANPAHAQSVKVVPKPGDGEWTVSFSRRNGPEVFELDSFHATLAAAKKRAQALTAWSNSMDANSGWRLAVILVEGEDGKSRVDDGTQPQPPDLKLKPNRKIGDVLREYGKLIQNAYENAKRARINLIASTESITQQQFDEVNRLIDSYNQQRDEIKNETGYFLAAAPPLSRVTPGELRAKIVPPEPEGIYQVWVYKLIGGQWVKQDERALGTDDEEVARGYVASVKSVRGWTATSNLPQVEPAEPEPIPFAAEPVASRVVGAWTGTYQSNKGSPFTTTLRFTEDGRVVSTTPSGRSGRGTWTMLGEELVQITWTNGAQNTWTMSGNRLSFSSDGPDITESASLLRD